MLVTTYQHDYVAPYTKRYAFIQGQKYIGEMPKVECQCIEETKIGIPENVQKQCPAVEWTGVAPMGRLIDARIIPTKFSDEQLEAITDETLRSDCFKEQPNRFLKILRTNYPDLYERLKQMPKDEMNRRLDRDRMFTTYQLDFCNINEYPEGIYESIKTEDETSKLNASKLLQSQEPCADLRTNAIEELAKEVSNNRAGMLDPCEKSYKPFKISFADSSRFINSGNSSHWRSNVFTKKAKFSEYMDTINKIGCIVMKNNIHDHQKCTKNHCRHQLLHACTNLK